MKSLYRNKPAIAVFLSPALILFVGIIIVPIILSFYWSFFDWNGLTDMKFIGFDNYVELFTSGTIKFPTAMLNVFLYAGLSVFVQLPFSLLLALLLAKGRRGSKPFLSIFFIPVIMSTVVIGQLWLKIYNPDYGILNVALKAVGLENWTNAWLGSKETALLSTFIPTMWQYTGYHMLLMYAGIRSVPPELREAALIDGATEWQVNRRIIIPMIKPVLKVCVIISIVGSLKVFDLIYILTNGGPAHATEVPSTLLVNMLFGRNRYGMGSAIAVILIFLCFFFAIIIRKMFKTEVD